MKLLNARPRHITSQILLAVLLPVIIVTAVIIAYYSWERYLEIERTERQFGELSAGYLAQAAELAIYAGDSEQLRKLARTARQRPSVARVCFLDSSAKILVEEGRALQANCDADLDSQQLVISSYSDSTLFSWPVKRSQLQVIDFDATRLEDQPDGSPIGWVVLSLDNQSILDAFRQMIASAALLGLAGLLIGVLFALRAGTTIGGPVRALTRHVKQLDSQAPSTVFPPAGTEEIVTLANGINQLVESVNKHIHNQKQRIDAATASLVRRNRQLEETRQILEQALQTKSDFLARMSHELRTPLTTIIGFNRLLRESNSPRQRREYSRHIEHASILLQSIIEDILDYSRLQSAALELESRAFNLHDCFEDVVGLHGYEAIERRIELVLLIDRDVPRRIIGDALRLKQVINNLLANAIKFTDRGEVVVHLELVESTEHAVALQCEVRDTGIGISAEHFSHLFEPFTQADNSISRKYGGTGLGLAICESLVQLMDGEISLSSDQGQGTTVVFSFVVKPDSTASSESPAAALENKSLLVYESNLWARRALSGAILDWGSRVRVCESTTDLLHQLQSSAPDLLILGLSHPEAGNQALVSLLGRIRSTYSGAIVLLSADPYLAKHINEGGIPLTGIEFALKPLRRQSLVLQCCRLLTTSATPAQIPARAPGCLAGLQLLVAEDHQPIRELLIQLLSQNGAQLTAATDGQQAIDLCDNTDFDLLIIDLHMPHLDGLTAISQLRQRGNEVPVICLTADVTAAERKALSWAGADAILLKPIEEATLLETIYQLCHRGGKMPADAGAGQKSGLVPRGELADQLLPQLLQTLARCRESCNSDDPKRLKAALHDMLGLAGIFEEKLLYALIREIAAEADNLSKEEAGQLFDEAEQLIRKH